jgi:hypothetical protein
VRTRASWAQAYYAQAQSDWAIFREFQQRSDIPLCHALHYLQMAAEKLAKAYRFRDSTAEAASLLTSHVGFGRFFNTFLRSPSVLEQYEGRLGRLRSVQSDCAKLARAVELLAPSVDRALRPANTEYPWDDGARIVAPIDHNFADLSLLYEPRGRLFLNLIARAFAEFGRG